MVHRSSQGWGSPWHGAVAEPIAKELGEGRVPMCSVQQGKGDIYMHGAMAERAAHMGVTLSGDTQWAHATVPPAT